MNRLIKFLFVEPSYDSNELYVSIRDWVGVRAQALIQFGVKDIIKVAHVHSIFIFNREGCFCFPARLTRIYRGWVVSFPGATRFENESDSSIYVTPSVYTSFQHSRGGNLFNSVSHFDYFPRSISHGKLQLGPDPYSAPLLYRYFISANSSLSPTVRRSFLYPSSECYFDPFHN